MDTIYIVVYTKYTESKFSCLVLLMEKIVTDNSEENNNKNFFLKFIDWVKRNTFCTYLLSALLFMFFCIIIFVFFNEIKHKSNENRNEYGAVINGPKRNLKSFPYITQFNNENALLFCGYSYHQGSVEPEYFSELYDKKSNMFIKLPKTSKHDTITKFVQKGNYLYIYGDYKPEIYDTSNRTFEILTEKSYNGRFTNSFKYKEKTIITNNGSLYFYNNLKHAEFKLKNSNIKRYNPYVLFLSDSQILIVGGHDKDNKEILQTEIYDFIKNQYQKAAILKLQNERIKNINQLLLEIYTDKNIYTYDKEKNIFNKRKKRVEYIDSKELILDDKYSLLYEKCEEKNNNCSFSAKVLDKQENKIIGIPKLLFYPFNANVNNVIKLDEKKFLIPVNYDSYFFEPRLETQIVEIY